jgi:hypothetical protein
MGPVAGRKGTPGAMDALRLSTILVATIACNVVACGGVTPSAKTVDDGPRAVAVSGDAGTPAWVTAPAAHKRDSWGTKVLCGEGRMVGDGIMGIEEESAARAKSALMRNLRAKVVAMLSDGTPDEQTRRAAVQQIAIKMFGSIVVEDRWVTSAGTMHTLACLHVPAFTALVSDMGQLDERTRATLVEHAEELADDYAPTLLSAEDQPPARRGE